MSNERKMPARAMLLAAGHGTRLRPLTDTVPKCMVKIAERPVLEHNILWLKNFGVTNLVINLHYMPSAVTDYFGDGRRFGVNITYSYETELLGTAGAVKNVEEFFNESFFLWYGDNLSNCCLDNLWRFHCEKKSTATIALHYREDPTQSGIVGLDENGRITRFLEKPKRGEVFSNWVNAGIYVLEKEVLDVIPSNAAFDFGCDVFPLLLERGENLYGYQMSKKEKLFWIDTLEDLERVKKLRDEYVGENLR